MQNASAKLRSSSLDCEANGSELVKSNLIAHVGVHTCARTGTLLCLEEHA